MSDPVTNVDIEDVLASIRRLVLPGPPGPVPGSPLGATARPAPLPGRSRLVLTQAQRIEPAGPDDEDPDGIADGMADGIGDGTPSVLDGLAGSAPADAAVPTDGPAAMAPPLLVLSGPLPAGDRAPWAVSGAGHEIDAVTGPEPASVDPAALLPEPPLALVPDFVPEAHPPDALSEPSVGRAAGAAGIEAALGMRDGDWEPDGSEAGAVLDWSLGDFAEAPAAPVFRHRAPPDEAPHPTPRPAFVPASSPEAPPASGTRRTPGPTAEEWGEAMVLDEAALRAIVTEALRAELQGELGERITRNVRKLVRREIFRVLEIREDD